jgi:hypothetical protein
MPLPLNGIRCSRDSPGRSGHPVEVRDSIADNSRQSSPNSTASISPSLDRWPSSMEPRTLARRETARCYLRAFSGTARAAWHRCSRSAWCLSSAPSARLFDYSHANLVRTAMQNALDATALMLSREAQGLDAPQGSFNLRVSATTTMPTMFWRLSVSTRSTSGPAATLSGNQEAKSRHGARQHGLDNFSRQDDRAQGREWTAAPWIGTRTTTCSILRRPRAQRPSTALTRPAPARPR